MHETKSNERSSCRRQATGERGDTKGSQPEEEEAAAAEEVSEGAAKEQQRGEREKVRVDDPLLPVQAHVEIAIDRRQRQEHHGLGEDPDVQANDGANPPPPPPRPLPHLTLMPL